MRNRLILWLILLVIGFLVGFVPQYLKSQQFQQQASAAAKQLQSCQAGEQLSQIRDNAALMYLEASQKNYGIARDYATRLFDQAQQFAASTDNAALHSLLGEVLATRDQITADLAKGDAAVVGEMQPVLSKIEHGAKP